MNKLVNFVPRAAMIALSAYLVRIVFQALDLYPTIGLTIIIDWILPTIIMLGCALILIGYVNVAKAWDSRFLYTFTRITAFLLILDVANRVFVTWSLLPSAKFLFSFTWLFTYVYLLFGVFFLIAGKTRGWLPAFIGSFFILLALVFSQFLSVSADGLYVTLADIPFVGIYIALGLAIVSVGLSYAGFAIFLILTCVFFRRLKKKYSGAPQPPKKILRAFSIFFFIVVGICFIHGGLSYITPRFEVRSMMSDVPVHAKNSVCLLTGGDIFHGGWSPTCHYRTYQESKKCTTSNQCLGVCHRWGRCSIYDIPSGCYSTIDDHLGLNTCPQ